MYDNYTCLHTGSSEDVHVHELYADGFTTSVQCAVTDIACITPLCMYIRYYAFCLASVPGLPHCVHVLIIRRRQTFWGRPGTEATFCCCSTVYIYSNECAVHVLYVHDLSMLTQALPTSLLLDCITLQYPHTVHMHVQYLAVHTVYAFYLNGQV